MVCLHFDVYLLLILPPLTLCLFVNTCDTTLLAQLLTFSETLQAATSTGSGLKVID